MVECKLSLELTKNGVQKSVHAKMGEKDSRKLLITLTEKGKVFDLEGYEARVSYDDKTYTKATIDGNVVEFILPSTLLSGPGERLCELEISVPGESVLYSPMFIVNVEGSLGAEAKNEAVGKYVEYQQVIPDLEETADMGDEAYIAVYEEGKGIKKYKVKGLGGASKHSELSGRDEADQHPIESVSGLRDTLDEIDGMTSHNNSLILELEKETDRLDNAHRRLRSEFDPVSYTVDVLDRSVRLLLIPDVDDLKSVKHYHDNKHVLDKFGIDSSITRPSFETKPLALSADVPSAVEPTHVASIVQGTNADNITNFASNGYLSGKGLDVMIRKLEELYVQKTDTYTQAEIDEKISLIPKFSIEPVDTLPETDISETTVYLVRNNEKDGNLYTEYIYVNGVWESLGSQSVDLTGYYTKEEIDDKGFITAEDIPEGGSAVIDASLTMSGAAADAKATGDRLLEVEYQTITTEEAYEHKDLPEGEKTVTINGNGAWGETAYVCSGEDLIPRKALNRTFPYNGVTITRNDKTYHIEGTSTAAFSAYVLESSNDLLIDLDESIAGKSIKLYSFSKTLIGAGLGLVVELLDSSDTQVLRKSIYIGREKTIYSSTIVAPATTAKMRVSLSISANVEFNHDIAFYVATENELTEVSASTSNLIDNDVSNLFTFPYESTVAVKLPLDDYIQYIANTSDGGTVTYLTPEDFGAVGDGYADDGAAIAQCLATASQTKQTVFMAKKYYVTSPIDIGYEGLQIIINDIIYDGTETAVKIHAPQNSIKIHSIASSGIGISFTGDSTYNVRYNDVEVNTIESASHGIAFFVGGNKSIYQTTVKFNFIKAGGSNCYGICYINGGDGEGFVGENNFYGGHIRDCEWAVYACNGNSKFYGIHIERNVQGGFYITGYITIFHPRNAEAQRDGALPFYKFIDTNYLNIYNSGNVPIDEYDLSEAVDTNENSTPLRESQFGVINGGIIARSADGENTESSTVYCDRAYVWGKYLIMTPRMQYRKVVNTEELDTTTLGQEETIEEVRALSQLPTKFIVNTVDTQIYLHESYCAFGFNEFEVEQANGFTCKVYDKMDNLIFDGAEQGNGVFKFKAYKDATYCEENSYGAIRVDFLGHYWEVTKSGDTII